MERAHNETTSARSLKDVRRDGGIIVNGFSGTIGFSLGVTVGKLSLLTGSAFPFAAGVSAAALGGGIIGVVLTPVVKDLTMSKKEAFAEGALFAVVGFTAGLAAESIAPQLFSSAAQTATASSQMVEMPGTVLCKSSGCCHSGALAGVPKQGLPLYYGTTELYSVKQGIEIPSAVLPYDMGTVSDIGSCPTDLGPRGCYRTYKAFIYPNASAALVSDYNPQINSGGSQLFHGIDQVRDQGRALVTSISGPAPNATAKRASALYDLAQFGPLHLLPDTVSVPVHGQLMPSHPGSGITLHCAP